MINKCPLCEGKIYLEIFSHHKIPTFLGEVHKTRKLALEAEFCKVNFVQCDQCGFVFNRSYKQLDYRTEYETSRSESIVFQKYLKSLVEKLNFHLPDNFTRESRIKKVLEIGAGDGHFAREFVNRIPLEYIAVDSSWNETNLPHIDGISCIAGIYETTMEFNPDLLILRHVLEHRSSVKTFMLSVLHESPEYVFLEVPCYEYFSKGKFNIFSNDHCSYFSKSSLIKFMNEIGYNELFVEFTFDDEYLISLFSKSENIIKNVYVTDDNSKSQNIIKQFEKWSNNLSYLFEKNSVLWGGGGKGKMICNMLNVDYRSMPYIVDINKKIWGHYVPVTANEIISPKILNDLKPENILITTPLYYNEITNKIRNMGLSSNVVSIF